MAHCGHSNWLNLRIEQNEIILLVSDRLQTLINEFPSPDLQQPSLLVFIGHAAKFSALQSLVVHNNSRKSTNRRKRGGEVHLHLGNPSVFHNAPALLAEGDLPYRVLKRKVLAQCHETRQLMLPRVRGGVQSLALEEAADHLYSRLLGSFADIFCFFSTDVGGFDLIVRRLASWLENGKPSTLPKTTYPYVVVVMETTDPGAESDKEASEILLGALRAETTKNPTEKLSAVEVVTVPYGGHCYRRLEEYLIQALNQCRKHKLEARTLFSARHLAAFFKYASDHFGRTTREPFDFVKASRLQNPISPDLDIHLSTFLKHIKSPEELMDFAAPTIASSLLLDHYPPGMHAFNPGDVFQTLYKDTCYQVGRSGVLVHDGSTNLVLPSGFVKIIAEQLEKCFDDFICGAGMPSMTVHCNNLKRFKLRWKRVRSNDTCLACLRRVPENNLPCGHSVCENCVRVFGKVNENDRWVYSIQRCFLCDMVLGDVMVKVKPDTAGVNVLTIDGGGVRGVVPLPFLQILQDRIGLPIPVQDNFDIAFGTSSGGLIVLALFINGWAVDDCLDIFESFARKAFRPRWVSRIPIVSRIPVLSHILKFVVSYFADGLYPARNLEDALKEVFGTDMSIQDHSYATAIGAKVGIPVTTVLETDPCLFTNYTGAGLRPQDCGYRIIQSNDGRERIRVWEIAMSGSAAPWYFPAKNIPGVGAIQDGGLWKNNPVDLPLWEIPVVWPLIHKPNVVISLGTGSSGPRAQESRSNRQRGRWRQGFLPRSYRAFMELINGKKIAQAFKNGRRAELDGRYFRFDVELDREVDLDDTGRMRELATKAREQFCLSEDVDDVARCLVATRFYFELESKPKKSRGKYYGSGHIFCCLPRNSPQLEALLGQLSKRAARFIVNNHWTIGTIGDRSFIDQEGNFCKRIEFETKDTLDILLQEGPAKPQHISGSPYAVHDLMDMQGFNNDFGSPDHRKRKEREEKEDGDEAMVEERAKKRRRVR